MCKLNLHFGINKGYLPPLHLQSHIRHSYAREDTMLLSPDIPFNMRKCRMVAVLL